MRAADDLAQPLRLKAIIVGDKGVGKTQLLNRCTDGSFNENEDGTNHIDLRSFTINFDRKNIFLLLWDTPGEQLDDPQHVEHYSNYITGSNIVIIVVNPTDDRVTKLAKINTWVTRIKQRTDIMPAIIIVENKMDLLGAAALADHDDQLNTIPHSLHLAVSIKNDVNFKLTLLNALRPIFPAILFMLRNPVTRLPDNKNHHQILPTLRPENDLTVHKQDINNLTDEQAKMILASLESLLILGPINEPNKRYSIFAGGKPLILKDGSTITVPEHVYDWVSKIVSASQFKSGHKQGLEQLYIQINQASVSKPFSRSATTHDFYANSLIGFIEYLVSRNNAEYSRDYNSIRLKINELSDEQIQTILVYFFVKLEKGNTLYHHEKPYDVSFWGGKSHTLSSSPDTIKVPGHISALIRIYTGPCESIKDKLINMLDYALVTKYSTCSSRNPYTSCLYEDLPRQLMEKINVIHSGLPRPMQAQL